ncbi:MAG: response regulator transcription factor [Flavobacteriales bacterium]|nr:response regulator transcription factor [Flavobacteriales bacterium]
MENQIKVLLVEDDPNLGTLLKDYLVAKGYNTELRSNGQEGYNAFVQADFDFLILDVMMPVKDGLTLAKEIRGIDKNVPMLFLTAKSMKEDTLEGFNAGADDYMTKPFSMEELLARMGAILRRTGGEGTTEESQYQVGKYIFKPLERTLEFNGDASRLTTKENDLLKLLCKNANGVLERNDALKAVWGDDNYFNGRSMDVYIAKLRKHLNKDEKIEIMNIHGRGFKLYLPE